MSEENQNKESETPKKEVTVTLSEEDIKAINDDLRATKESLVTSEIKDKAKAEAKEEMEMQRKLEEAQNKQKELEEKLLNKEKETAEKFESFQKKMDSMISSKAAIINENPFETEKSMSKEVDNWSDEKVNQFEEESARKFFGSDYDTRI